MGGSETELRSHLASTDELLAIVAHGLLNSLSIVSGAIDAAVAVGRIGGAGADGEVRRLLDIAANHNALVAEQVRSLVLGPGPIHALLHCPE